MNIDFRSLILLETAGSINFFLFSLLRNSAFDVRYSAVQLLNKIRKKMRYYEIKKWHPLRMPLSFLLYYLSVLDYFFNASFIKTSHNSSKPIPMEAAALGRRLVSVIPGIVLISRTYGIFLFDRMKSTRPKSLQ